MEDIDQAVPCCCVRRKASYDVAPTMPRCSDSYLVSTSDFLPTIFTNLPSFVRQGVSISPEMPRSTPQEADPKNEKCGVSGYAPKKLGSIN